MKIYPREEKYELMISYVVCEYVNIIRLILQVGEYTEVRLEAAVHEGDQK